MTVPEDVVQIQGQEAEFEINAPDETAINAIPSDQLLGNQSFTGSASVAELNGSAGPGTSTCKYESTSYAGGGVGDGDEAFSGYDTDLDAHAAAHARSGLTNTTRRVSNAYASAGIAFIFRKKGGGTKSLDIIMPWNDLGEMTTQVQSDGVNWSQASAETRVALVVRDMTTKTTLHSLQVHNPTASGQTSKQPSANGTSTFSITAVDGHKYAAYIRVTTIAETDTPYPALQSDSLNNFLQTPRRAWLDFVKLRLTSGSWASC